MKKYSMIIFLAISLSPSILLICSINRVQLYKWCRGQEGKKCKTNLLCFFNHLSKEQCDSCGIVLNTTFWKASWPTFKYFFLIKTILTYYPIFFSVLFSNMIINNVLLGNLHSNLRELRVSAPSRSYNIPKISHVQSQHFSSASIFWSGALHAVDSQREKINKTTAEASWQMQHLPQPPACQLFTPSQGQARCACVTAAGDSGLGWRGVGVWRVCSAHCHY